MKFSKARRLSGELTIPGDKSISHRSIMFGSIAEGLTEVRGFLQGADCLSTIDCFRRLGVQIDVNAAEGQVAVHGKGMHGLGVCPGAGNAQKTGRPDGDLQEAVLDTGNSGTTTRLISRISLPCSPAMFL